MKVPENIQLAVIDFFCGELDNDTAAVLIAWLEECVENRKFFNELSATWYAIAGNGRCSDIGSEIPDS